MKAIARGGYTIAGRGGEMLGEHKHETIGVYKSATTCKASVLGIDIAKNTTGTHLTTS
jgi:hypothetical protein